jgi:hypothetical protein
MNFEWDETKRQQNLAKHGIDFLGAALAFDGRAAMMLYSACQRGSLEDDCRDRRPFDHRRMDLAGRDMPDHFGKEGKR